MKRFNLDFDKITVISTKKENQSSVVFPEEGWFVGTENTGVDHFVFYYLYSPKFTSLSYNTWGGYLDKEKTQWWTFNLLCDYINTDFLYICKDKETAVNLTKLLNNSPSKDLFKIDSDIVDIDKEIEALKKKQALLRQTKNIVKLLTTSINTSSK